jgi:hypothetical protein
MRALLLFLQVLELRAACVQLVAEMQENSSKARDYF